MRTFALIAFSALALSAAVPAFAQDAMASHDQMAAHDSMKSDSMKSGSMKMSAGSMRKMKTCNAMSHDAMMKNAGCAKMMKMHPDMMKHDDMMSSGH